MKLSAIAKQLDSMRILHRERFETENQQWAIRMLPIIGQISADFIAFIFKNLPLWELQDYPSGRKALEAFYNSLPNPAIDRDLTNTELRRLYYIVFCQGHLSFAELETEFGSEQAEAFRNIQQYALHQAKCRHLASNLNVFNAIMQSEDPVRLAHVLSIVPKYFSQDIFNRTLEKTQQQNKDPIKVFDTIWDLNTLYRNRCKAELILILDFVIEHPDQIEKACTMIKTIIEIKQKTNKKLENGSEHLTRLSFLNNRTMASSNGPQHKITDAPERSTLR